jgi:uncharacterized membrane protein YfcA
MALDLSDAPPSGMRCGLLPRHPIDFVSMDTWIILLFCGWLAGTVSGAAGFGGALLLLPVLALTMGGRAVPILTVAQLLGNLSRAGFGWREIRWRPALLFSLGAVPASVVGARLFVALPAILIRRLIGGFLLLFVGIRRTARGRRRMPDTWLAPAGAVVGFLSGLAGSAGPLGAAVFLGLHLPPTAYVASEAVTAALMHLTKSLVYGRYSAMTPHDLLVGVALGGALALGSWTGRRLLEQVSEEGLSLFIEALLVISAFLLIAGRR